MTSSWQAFDYGVDKGADVFVLGDYLSQLPKDPKSMSTAQAAVLYDQMKKIAAMYMPKSKLLDWSYSLTACGDEAHVAAGTGLPDLYWCLATVQEHEGTNLLLAGPSESLWLAPYRLRVMTTWSDGRKRLFRFQTYCAADMAAYAIWLSDRLHDL